jgi:MFS family permease
MALRRYRSALATPYVAWLLGSSLVGRLPSGMEGLALLLLVTRHGSYATAGAITAAYLLANCAVSPLVTRGLDRLGRRRLLPVLGAGYAAASVALAVVPPHPHLLAAVAAAAGLCTPPLAPSARAAWPALLDGRERQAVFALEATLQELVFIAGPAPTIASRGPPSAASPTTSAGGGAVLRAAGVRRVVIAGVAVVAAFSAGEIAAVAFVSGSTASTSAGVVLAVWSLGSFLGGLAFGARARDVAAALPLAAVGIGFAAVAAAPGPVVLTVLLFACGTAIAPALALLYDRLGTLAPAGSATEAFGWLASGSLAGAAGGAALGGVLVSAYGPRVAFLVAAGLALAAAAVAEPLAALRRRSWGSSRLVRRVAVPNPMIGE